MTPCPCACHWHEDDGSRWHSTPCCDHPIGSNLVETCAKVADERAQENFRHYEMLREVNPDAAGNFNIAAREALYIAAAIRAALSHS